MKTIYRLADWTSASKMKNVLHPTWRIDVEVVFTDLNHTDYGYHFKIYDIVTQEIYYAFYIGVNNYYCINDEEALHLFNVMGFYCELKEKPDYFITDTVKTTLNALLDLGYEIIARIPAPEPKVIVMVDSKEVCLEQIYPEYDYQEYHFLKDYVPTSIKGILKDIE